MSFQSTVVTHAEWPVRLPTCSPCCMSYRAMMAASPAAASLVDPGEKATVRMGFVKPKSGYKMDTPGWVHVDSYL